MPGGKGRHATRAAELAAEDARRNAELRALDAPFLATLFARAFPHGRYDEQARTGENHWRWPTHCAHYRTQGGDRVTPDGQYRPPTRLTLAEGVAWAVTVRSRIDPGEYTSEDPAGLEWWIAALDLPRETRYALGTGEVRRDAVFARQARYCFPCGVETHGDVPPPAVVRPLEEIAADATRLTNVEVRVATQRGYDVLPAPELRAVIAGFDWRSRTQVGTALLREAIRRWRRRDGEAAIWEAAALYVLGAGYFGRDDVAGVDWRDE